jgi:hypothetical protein
MPPGPAFNWFCVAQGAFDILSRAAQIRVTQAESQAARLLRKERQRVSPKAGVTQQSDDVSLPAFIPAAPPAEPPTVIQAADAPPPEQPALSTPQLNAPPAIPALGFSGLSAIPAPKPLSIQTSASDVVRGEPETNGDTQCNTLPNTALPNSPEASSAHATTVVQAESIGNTPVVDMEIPEVPLVSQIS